MNKRRSIRARIAFFTLITAGGYLATVLLAMPAQTLSAEEHGKKCGIAQLEGDWGVSVSGTRVAGPGTTESFIGVALRTYDGLGGFIEVANSHGQVTGVTTPTITGTYTVNADCTGTTRFVPPGAPVVVETAFVIVDKGDELRDVVLRPQPNLVTAVQRRVH